MRVVDAWLEDDEGERVENVEQGAPIRLNVVFEARQELEAPVFGFHFLNVDGVHVFGFNRTLERPEARERIAPPAARARSRGGSRTRCCPGATS